MTEQELLTSTTLYPRGSKLSQETREEIRRRHFEDGLSQSKLSRIYGVSRGTIQNYIRGEIVYKDKLEWSEEKEIEWKHKADEINNAIMQKYNTPSGVKRG